MGGSPVYKNIILCTEFSDDAHMAFTHSLDLPRKYKARVYLLHVMAPRNPCATPLETSHTPKNDTTNDRDRVYFYRAAFLYKPVDCELLLKTIARVMQAEEERENKPTWKKALEAHDQKLGKPIPWAVQKGWVELGL